MTDLPLFLIFHGFLARVENMDDKSIGIASRLIEYANIAFSFESMIILLVISLAILKIPHSILEMAGVSLSEQVISGASLTFIISSCMLFVRGIFKIGRSLREWVLGISLNRYFKKAIKELNAEEFDCLMRFFFPISVEIRMLNIQTPTVIGLINKGIIFPVVIGSHSLDSVPCQISNNCKPYLFPIIADMKKDMIKKEDS